MHRNYRLKVSSEVLFVGQKGTTGDMDLVSPPNRSLDQCFHAEALK